MRRAPLLPWLVLLPLLVASVGCRGSTSRRPPIHPQQNMDQVARLDPQEPSAVFPDGRSFRGWPEGTVPASDPRGDSPPCALPESDPHFCFGRDSSGDFATTLPDQFALDAALLRRGQERFGIFCAPCHDRTGSADGMVARRGMKPVSYHTEIVRNRPVGRIFDTITNGGPVMPPHGVRIPVSDRWAIAAYVRALQISQYASIEIVPAEIAAAQGWSKP